MRVPLIFAGPDIAEGVISRTPVSLVDLYPTCIDFAAIQASHNLDGHSYADYLKILRLAHGMAQTWSERLCFKVEVEKMSQLMQSISILASGLSAIATFIAGTVKRNYATRSNEWKNEANNPEYQSVIRVMSPSKCYGH